VLFSTAVFAAFHLPGIPVTQIVGGIVFAVAYHTGKSLMVPIVIHVLGNLAIFSLSLPSSTDPGFSFKGGEVSPRIHLPG
jgi:membrane protease YdiL (CAAX protease family)